MGDVSTDEYSPLSEADLAFLNDSLGISTDGVRQSAAWKLSNYGDSGALTDAQIERLVAQFSLSRNQLRELSWYLGHALGGTPSIVSINRSKAAAEAAVEIAQAIKDLADAARKLEKAKDRLAQLCVDDDFGPDGRKRFSGVKNQLAQSQVGVQMVDEALLEVSATPGFALRLRHNDTRSIPDYRRGNVLSEIMSFWHSIGRKLTYTTDPSNSARRGELIDFVNVIVGCISDPPGKLSGEIIIAAIKQHKAWVDHDVSVLDD